MKTCSVIISLTLALCAALTPARAGTPVGEPDAVVRSEAARLRALAERLTDYGTLEASFVQTRILGKVGQTLTSTGTVAVNDRGDFSWVQTTPFKQTVRLEGERFSIQYEDEQPDVMTEASHPAVWSAARLLVSVVRMDLPVLGKHFTTSLTDGSDGRWQVVLEPTDPTLRTLLGTVTLTGDTVVRRIVMAPGQDNRTEMVFESVRSTPKAAAKY